MTDNLTRSQAIGGVNRMIKTIKNLESQQSYPIDIAFATVSNPPTAGEINATFAIPSDIGIPFIGLIVDITNARQWLVFTDGSTTWYTVNQPQQPTPSPFTVGDGVTTAQIVIDGGAGTFRQLSLRTAGNFRWNILVNNTAESGANAGSDFRISRHDDAGTFIANVLAISRDTGAWTIPGSVTTQSGITNTGALTHTGTTQLVRTDLTLANGDNNDIALPANATWIRATGPTAAFAVTGFAGGATGRTIVLTCAVNQSLTIRNNSGSSAVGNRLGTGTGADITVGNVGQVIFIYDAVTAIWRVVSARGSAGAF
jgi:hypothetical protein